MIIFFCNQIQGEFAHFSEEESKHCVQVLRKKPGDTVQFIDGVGHWYEGQISEASKRQVVVQIMSKQPGTDHTGFHLHMAVAPLKSMDRFEWFLEKATEIGVDEITPLLTEHTERSKLRYDRLEKIILSAAKQCLRTRLPKLNELVDFEDFIKPFETNSPGIRFIPHCHEANLPHLKNNCPAGTDVTLLIGPEGDFSKAEVQQVIARGFVEVGLGANRLRTETAAIVACHTIHLANI
ncbi:MAG: 16S rRNA (uracil(1498)-N(3))-methyltransferase [Saprospiraceae bacterium]|nr:16S rRNA (uracil(1498)-N(3))-methyltransferase [Saprospiraceae bacterium]MCF8249727.1 16S rRNA (uracil(1498)-N(3))-methyltransferase [Saprospiraceae bacterium]MCF8282513.1 16S rRNA (uracil(1498)-N(3))-methyltransferase [Bacteroidales bacterium]MCF8314098.1 16S rRNA (uracil(1498)-N(3))-methyltransferase [Saprospiraceae bacterium]MCF8442843.1 16S rRNA (uracil(1498)-N(3))-methyltransferase [Saprospiraceae bacterium]